METTYSFDNDRTSSSSCVICSGEDTLLPFEEWSTSGFQNELKEIIGIKVEDLEDQEKGRCRKWNPEEVPKIVYWLCGQCKCKVTFDDIRNLREVVEETQKSIDVKVRWLGERWRNRLVVSSVIKVESRVGDDFGLGGDFQEAVSVPPDLSEGQNSSRDQVRESSSLNNSSNDLSLSYQELKSEIKIEPVDFDESLRNDEVPEINQLTENDLRLVKRWGLDSKPQLAVTLVRLEDQEDIQQHGSELPCGIPTRNLSSPRRNPPATCSQSQEHRLSPSQVAEKFRKVIEEVSNTNESSSSPDEGQIDGFLTSRKNSSSKPDGVQFGADGMFHCDMCPKVFEDKKVAIAHRYYHQRGHKYRCDHCGAKFKQNSDLKRHNRIHHNPAKRKPIMHCQQCFRSFTDKRYLKMHIKRYNHSDEQENYDSRKGIMQSGLIRPPGGNPVARASSQALNMAKLRMRNIRAYPAPIAVAAPENATPDASKPKNDIPDETPSIISSIPPELKVEVEKQEPESKDWSESDADFTIEAIEIEPDDEINSAVLESWGPESQSTSMPYDEDKEEISTIEEQEYMRDERNTGQDMSEEDPLAGTEDSLEMQCQGCNRVFTSKFELNEHECYDASEIEQHDYRQNESLSSYEFGRRGMRGTTLAARLLPSEVRRFCDDCGKPFTQRIPAKYSHAKYAWEIYEGIRLSILSEDIPRQEIS